MPIDTEKLKSLLFEALQRESGDARTAFVEEQCGDDRELKEMLLSLVDSHDRAGDYFENPVITVQETTQIEPIGTQIGRYKLLEKIGERGMGVVYMAEQTEPVTRKVALKIIKLGMDTRQVTARFEAERQALAMMDHPNISKVLDGGATENGRPYFVMELVRGEPITKFCQSQQLDLEQRLALFRQVCDAVQHAHQKGVIHRDIKPNNVLVTLDYGKPTPKVIDFGIAKATNQKLTEKTLFTQFAQMIGTPAYMSPEQAEMTSLDVDTRTDVYSLGVLLYELLTDSTPFSEKKLRSVGYDEMRRIIREEEPEKPSTRLTKLRAGSAGTVKNKVGTNSKRADSSPSPGGEGRGEGGLLDRSDFPRNLPTDLDWIVMKALDKDRRRRYDTPNEIVDDIERHLKNEPVEASPPSRLYQARKFVRRHRVMVAAGVAVGVALILGTLVALIGFQKAQYETQQARRIIYLTEIQLAQEAIKNSNPGYAKQLLESHITQNVADDFRGWEWRWLWNQVADDSAFKLGDHPTMVGSLTVSIDGVLAASSDYAGNIIVWDIASRSRQVEFVESNIVHGLQFLSEHILASANNSGIVSFYDVAKKTRLKDLDLGASAKAIAVSASGDKFAAQMGVDGGEIVRVWRVTTSNENPKALHLEELAQTPNSNTTAPKRYLGGGIAFNPNGDRLVAGYADGYLRIHDTVSGISLVELPFIDGPVYSVAWSPDGRWIAAGGRNEEVGIWDSNGQRAGTLPGHVRYPRKLVFRHDSKSLFVASGDQTIREWKIPNWTMDRALLAHRGPVDAMALLPSDDILISGGKDGQILGWDLSIPSSRVNPARISGMVACRFSPSGRWLASVEPADHLQQNYTVCLRSNANYEKRIELPELIGVIHDVIFSQNEEQLIVLGNDVLTVWNLIENRIEQIVTVPNPGRKLIVGFTARGKGLVLIDESYVISIWDVLDGGIDRTWATIEDGTIVPPLSHSHVAYHAASGVLIIGQTKRATVWDVGKGEKRGDLSGHHFRSVEAAISADGKRIATLGADGEFIIWDARNLKKIGKFQKPPHPINSAAFSPDGRRLAIGYFRFGLVAIFDVESRLQLITLPPEPSIARRLQWSPDGNCLVIQADETLIWNLPSSTDNLVSQNQNYE